MSKTLLPFHSIDRKVLIATIISGSIVILLATVFALYVYYKYEREIQESSLKQVNERLLDNIAKGTWTYNRQIISKSLEQILKVDGVISATVYDNENDIVGNKQTTNPDKSFSKYFHKRVYPLIHHGTSEAEAVGRVEVLVSNYRLYGNLVKRASLYFIHQAFIVVLASIIIVLIFQHIVTRHINKMVQHFSSQSLFADERLTEIKLDRNLERSADELTLLVKSFNSLVKRVNENYNQQQKELKLKDDFVVHSSRLASIGEMAGSIGHEINNPLTIISGYNDKMLRVVKDLAEGKDLSQANAIHAKLDESINRIGKIVSGLRSLSHSGYNNNIELSSVGSIIEETDSIVTESFRSRHINFNIEYKNVSPDFVLNARKLQLSQVILNLLNNAKHAVTGRKQPQISLIIQKDGNFLYIYVNDNGPGIPEAFRTKVFEAFFTTKPEGVGTGLGLSISKRIVEEHNGRLFINEDSSLTSICVQLPIKFAKSA